MSRLRSNFHDGTLSAGITDVATTISSANFAGLPVVAAPDTLALVLDPEGVAGNPEIVTVTTHTAAATSVTVTRGAEGTAARAHLINVPWLHGPTAEDWDVNIEVITDALEADPDWTPSGQIVDSSSITATIATTSGSPGVAVTGLTVTVPASDVPTTIGWGGHVICAAGSKFIAVDLLEDGVQIDRVVSGFGFANDIHKVWTETVVDPDASDRIYTAKVWSVDSTTNVSVYAGAGFPWWMIARSG